MFFSSLNGIKTSARLTLWQLSFFSCFQLSRLLPSSWSIQVFWISSFPFLVRSFSCFCHLPKSLAYFMITWINLMILGESYSCKSCDIFSLLSTFQLGVWNSSWSSLVSAGVITVITVFKNIRCFHLDKQCKPGICSRVRTNECAPWR